MTSRREEKELRRQERIAAEQAQARAERRGRLLRMLAAGVLATGALAAVIVALAVSGGGGDQGGTASADGPPIPAQQEADLQAAARAAGCQLRSPANEGSEHTDEAPIDYRSNPPTSGDHDPVAAEDGIYTADNAPEAEATVHSLEHGRINIQYRPETPARRAAQLETLAAEREGYHVLVYPNQTSMPYAVAATGWDQMVGCREFTDKSFDAIRAFRAAYTDKAPEFVP